MHHWYGVESASIRYLTKNCFVVIYSVLLARKLCYAEAWFER
jgi:hypothetical protein